MNLYKLAKGQKINKLLELDKYMEKYVTCNIQIC